MQNCAILRNALRKRNYESPGVSNDMQSSETLRNSLGLNYESPALTAELQARRALTREHPTLNVQRPIFHFRNILSNGYESHQNPETIATSPVESAFRRGFPSHSEVGYSYSTSKVGSEKIGGTTPRVLESSLAHVASRICKPGSPPLVPVLFFSGAPIGPDNDHNAQD